MNKLLSRARLGFFAIMYVVVNCPLILKAQKTNSVIVLINKQLSEKTYEFYVQNIVDERADRSAVAWLLPVGANLPQIRYNVDLQGGCTNAVRQFANVAIAPDKALRPVIIRIEKLRLVETAMADGRAEGKLEILLSFDLKKEDNNVHLIDYPASTVYYRAAGQQYDNGVLMSRALEAALNYFNKWINRQADTNIKLAKEVKLIFSDYTEKPEGDTIYYSAGRPLSWDDFQDKPRNGKYVALVLPSFGYTEKVEVVKSIVTVRISMRVFLPKSAAWVKPDGRSNYGLNHEQRHFDIVRIIAERFKLALLAMKLPVDNYDGYINVQYLDSFREMNQMEDLYDAETSHGMNAVNQQEWNGKIDRLLNRH